MFNPERLVLARTRRGVTKRALAERIGISRRSLTYYEAGEKEPEISTKEQLSKALGFPLSFFSLDDPERIPDTSVSFRSLSRMTLTQRDAVLAAASIGLELNDFINERFDLPAADIPDAHESADAEGAAEEVRASWGVGERPISNVVHLLEARGVRVFSLAEDCSEIDAFSFWRGETPFIFLNTKKSAERSRFDASHELGHLVLHRHRHPRGREAEEEANAFASAFLMPRQNTIARAPMHPSVRGIVQGKKVWGVSAMAYAFRLYKIGSLTDWQYHQLVRKMSTSGFRTTEPEPAPRESSQLLRKVFDALRSDGITRNEIAARLCLFPEDLDQFVFGLVMTGIQGGGCVPGGSRPHLRLVDG